MASLEVAVLCKAEAAPVWFLIHTRVPGSGRGCAGCVYIRAWLDCCFCICCKWK